MFIVSQDELLASVKSITFIKRKQDKEIKTITKTRLLLGDLRLETPLGKIKTKQNKELYVVSG